jgi:hypothetical protein
MNLSDEEIILAFRRLPAKEKQRLLRQLTVVPFGCDIPARPAPVEKPVNDFMAFRCQYSLTHSKYNAKIIQQHTTQSSSRRICRSGGQGA